MSPLVSAQIVWGLKVADRSLTGQFGDDGRMGRFRHGRSSERRKDAGDGRRGAQPVAGSGGSEERVYYATPAGGGGAGLWAVWGGAKMWDGSGGHGQRLSGLSATQAAPPVEAQVLFHFL
jgi:hypothetical protein